MGIRFDHVHIYRGFYFDLFFKNLHQKYSICFDSNLNLLIIRFDLIQYVKQI